MHGFYTSIVLEKLYSNNMNHSVCKFNLQNTRKKEDDRSQWQSSPWSCLYLTLARLVYDLIFLQIVGYSVCWLLQQIIPLILCNSNIVHLHIFFFVVYTILKVLPRGAKIILMSAFMLYFLQQCLITQKRTKCSLYLIMLHLEVGKGNIK